MKNKQFLFHSDIPSGCQKSTNNFMGLIFVAPVTYCWKMSWRAGTRDCFFPTTPRNKTHALWANV